MAEPKTELDHRLDQIELNRRLDRIELNHRLDRIERAIGTMASWLVQAQTGFNAKDAEGIEKILRGESLEDKPDASEEPETT